MMSIRASNTHHHAEINIVNNAELHVNSQSILIIIHKFCLKNIIEAYKSKQKKFKLFCEKKQYQNNDTITENKLLLFLVKKIVNQSLRMKSCKTDNNVLQNE